MTWTVGYPNITPGSIPQPKLLYHPESPTLQVSPSSHVNLVSNLSWWMQQSGLLCGTEELRGGTESQQGLQQLAEWSRNVAVTECTT